VALLWAVAGLLVGPFLNLAIYRLPRLERLAAPPVCPRCRAGRPLYSISAVVVSLLGEGGACSGCGARPGRAEVAVELGTGLVFWLLFLRFGFGPRLLLYSLYSCFLIVVFMIDWEHRLILNKVTYPGILLALALTPLATPVGWGMAAAGAAVAGLLFGGLYLLGYLLFHQEALGMGDVKLSVLLGAMAGFPAVVWWLLLGSVFGAAGGLAMAALRRGSLRGFIPYGSAMCLGALVALLIDPSVLLS